eukprot:TRINITY_DN78_c0_g1_i2.p1 TRINITY_DN78_c0_g1~~TRINITY_DN78_c0_g1_i2.p1  ORF type:complete len:237 (+),score=60.87 TRINITY_DN78_c0_g1_i2:92-802(+)
MTTVLRAAVLAASALAVAAIDGPTATWTGTLLSSTACLVLGLGLAAAGHRLFVADRLRFAFVLGAAVGYTGCVVLQPADGTHTVPSLMAIGVGVTCGFGMMLTFYIRLYLIGFSAGMLLTMVVSSAVKLHTTPVLLCCVFVGIGVLADVVAVWFEALVTLCTTAYAGGALVSIAFQITHQHFCSVALPLMAQCPVSGYAIPLCLTLGCTLLGSALQYRFPSPALVPSSPLRDMDAL